MRWSSTRACTKMLNHRTTVRFVCARDLISRVIVILGAVRKRYPYRGVPITKLIESSSLDIPVPGHLRYLTISSSS